KARHRQAQAENRRGHSRLTTTSARPVVGRAISQDKEKPQMKIIITQCSTGYHAYRSDDQFSGQGEYFETPDQLAEAGYSIAQLSEMINRITGKNSRQPSIARAAKRLFSVLEAEK